jgi:glycosyltransferase involved in cell wall biosynthesis
LIPAFQEEDRIGEVVDSIRAQELPLDLLVIDDGSTDETARVARKRGALVVHHPFNIGYGAALHTGYIYALRHGYERIVQMDADGQHDPESLPDVLAAIDQGADVVVGSRYRDGRAPPTSWTRKLGSRLFGFIVRRWTGVDITDPTSGFQAMNARALDVITHDGFPEDYPDADIIITLARSGMRVVEVPVRMFPRRGGVSMHRGGRMAYYVYKMFLTLLLLPVRRLTPFRARNTVAGLS